MKRELKKLMSKINPCQCDDGGPETTYMETDLNGKIFKISCSECFEEISFNESDEIVKDWNKLH